MVRPVEQENDQQDTLDPAAEKVRRKLVRFMGINLAILFAAVMAVVLAFVYKSVQPTQTTEETLLLPGDATHAAIALPQGARIVSQALDGMRVSLQLRLADGTEELHVYDLRSGQLQARATLGQ
ncbi:hypothetical protein [Nitratireductor pacificus]|uniref:Putative fimbrial subunit PilA n=1 Tax=Nitratireductor pacificus pht-3B TaxID=391937 RepID=K2MDD5_9HYPH|nr:hypothetical protein [Nitratireductor pacificus]EKF18795.1 putative fimbrial subunit PilA [Nitratireductor pacificus pht-3B]